MEQKRKDQAQRVSANNRGPLKDRINGELDTFINEEVGTIDSDANPNTWWRENNAKYPLLRIYWRAHGSYNATNANSERVFNQCRNVLSDHRYLDC